MLIYAGDLVIGPSGVPRKVSVKPSAVAVPPPHRSVVIAYRQTVTLDFSP